MIIFTVTSFGKGYKAVNKNIFVSPYQQKLNFDVLSVGRKENDPLSLLCDVNTTLSFRHLISIKEKNSTLKSK